MDDFLTNLGGKRPSTSNPSKVLNAKIILLILWLLIIGGYYGYARQNDLTAGDVASQISQWLIGSLYGPIFYIVLYALRPLIFFPATILTLLGGFLFGPIGILYTIFGSNASAMVAYTIGRYFGQNLIGDVEDEGLWQRYTKRMRQNGFETVLIMRLIFLPYDLVNYAAGLFKIRWQAFLAATAIGSVPGTVAVVLLGASFGTLDELLTGDIQLNPTTLFISVALIGASMILSRVIKKREAAKEGLDDGKN